MNDASPKVSIVITAHNYAKFLTKSLESALNQAYDSFEVILVDDGSTDHTPGVVARYQGEPRLRLMRLDGVGLAAAANRGIAAARGEYIVRLDADDWFDDHLVLIEASFLDRHPDIDMVFCDFHTVDVHGDLIQTIRRAKLNEEVELLDRPCLAAGAMYRRRCWEAIGGYNESVRYQEDYDFWIKFIERFHVRNLSLPLMYYRQHGSSMSRNWDARMQTRRQIKHKFVEDHRESYPQRILAVIPARADRIDGVPLALLPVAGGTLLERCIRTVGAAAGIERLVVATESPAIAEHAVAAGAEVPFLRSRASTSPAVPFEHALGEFVNRLRDSEGYWPEIVVICHPHCPFIDGSQITEAIDTLLLYKTDSVIAVVEDLTYHWQPGRDGLEPVGYQQRVVRQEKDLIYKESGGLYVVDWRNVTRTGDFLGKRVGHIELASHEAFRIAGPWEYQAARAILAQAAADGDRQ